MVNTLVKPVYNSLWLTRAVNKLAKLMYNVHNSITKLNCE